MGGGAGEGARGRFLEGERGHREETTHVARPELELDLGSGVHSQSSRSAPAHFRDLVRAQGLRPAWKSSNSELDVINEGKITAAIEFMENAVCVSHHLKTISVHS